jgi:hypothetical protein
MLKRSINGWSPEEQVVARCRDIAPLVDLIDWMLVCWGPAAKPSRIALHVTPGRAGRPCRPRSSPSWGPGSHGCLRLCRLCVTRIGGVSPPVSGDTRDNMQQSNRDGMDFWISVAHSRLTLNQCCSLRCVKSFCNNIGTKRRKTMSAPTSASGGESGNVTDGPNSTLVPSRPREFHPEPLTEPDLILSHHPARAIARRLPPSVEPSGSSWFDPVGPNSTAMTHPLGSTSITLASSLLQGSPSLTGASVFSASRLEPLVPFPLASPARFSRSAQEPGRASRRLHAGCRSGSLRTSPELIPEDGSASGFDIT